MTCGTAFYLVRLGKRLKIIVRVNASSVISPECIEWWEIKQFIHVRTVSNQFVQRAIQNVSQFTLT